MTKTAKAVIFFISMRLTAKYAIGQALVFLVVMALCACDSKREEAPVIPPVTSPLSRNYIGFGVVIVSYTHISAEPAEDSVSLGYLRRGSLVRISKRQTVKTGNTSVSWVWVLAEGANQGWLKEEVIDIYDSESQAKTAIESLAR